MQNHSYSSVSGFLRTQPHQIWQVCRGIRCLMDRHLHMLGNDPAKPKMSFWRPDGGAHCPIEPRSDFWADKRFWRCAGPPGRSLAAGRLSWAPRTVLWDGLEGHGERFRNPDLQNTYEVFLGCRPRPTGAGGTEHHPRAREVVAWNLSDRGL